MLKLDQLFDMIVYLAFIPLLRLRLKSGDFFTIYKIRK